MENIFKISKDIERAKYLRDMARERMEDIIVVLPRDKHYKIIEEYYEVIVQLITSIMYADGYKTLSHIKLIDYISENYKEISKEDAKLVNHLRKLRHGTVYYGKKIGKEFLINHEGEIKLVINKLFGVVGEKLK